VYKNNETKKIGREKVKDILTTIEKELVWLNQEHDGENWIISAVRTWTGQ
jgi:hypothetical protein